MDNYTNAPVTQPVGQTYAQPVPEQTFITANFRQIKELRFASIFVTVFVSIAYATISVWIDDDLLIGLPFVILAFGSLIALAFVSTLKYSLKVTNYSISGCRAFFKNYNIPLNLVASVDPAGINGITIKTLTNVKYKIEFIGNRDEVCTLMSDLGLPVNNALIIDRTATVASTPVPNAQKNFFLISAASAALFNLCTIISTLWYVSPSNTYTDYYSSSWGYGGYYWTGHYTWIEEMFTTYLGFFFLAVSIAFFVVYILTANHKVSLGSIGVRGVNIYGKAVFMPYNEIRISSVNRTEKYLSINHLGKRRRYYLIANYVSISDQINAIVSQIASAAAYNQTPAPAYAPVAQPVVQQPVAQPVAQQYVQQPVAQPAPQTAGFVDIDWQRYAPLEAGVSFNPSKDYKFHRAEGFVGSVPQTFVNRTYPKCPICCSTNPYWTIAQHNQMSWKGNLYLFKCSACDGIISMSMPDVTTLGNGGAGVAANPTVGLTNLLVKSKSGKEAGAVYAVIESVGRSGVNPICQGKEFKLEQLQEISNRM